MTVQQFQEMKTLEKIQYMLERGEEVMSRVYLFYNIRLYAVGNFFVEIWYRQIAGKIDYVEVVDFEHVFLNYKKEIDISDLYQKN